MHIKRFEAPTMEQALARVKAELGPDALILSSRTVQRGRQAFGLLSRRVVEVQAAAERGSAGSAHAPRTTPDGNDVFASAPSTRLERTDLQCELARLSSRERFEDEVRSELRGLRQALNGLVSPDRRQDLDPAIVALTRTGLDVAHGASLAEECRTRTEAGSGLALDELLRVRIGDRIAPPREDEGGRVRVLVGAPGVGKTTTLAKIAARSEEGEREIALVSLDHYRIGATDQLRRYAELFESPFVEVTEVERIKEVVASLRGHSVLIDTAGRGRGNRDRLAPLLPLRECLGKDASLELVLDATARPEVQRAHLGRFSALEPDRVIFAKTDECDSLVPLANVMLDRDCPPVCWMGTGQRVPEDLELVEVDDIVRDVLGEAA